MCMIKQQPAYLVEEYPDFAKSGPLSSWRRLRKGASVSTVILAVLFGPAGLLAADISLLVTGIPFSSGSPTITTRSHLVVKGTSLFWTDGSSTPVKKVPVIGGAVTPLAIKVGVPVNLVVRGQDIFWIDDQSGIASSGCVGPGVIRVLKKTSLDGTLTIVLGNGDSCAGGTSDIVVDESSVYWVNSTASPNTYTLVKVPIAGGAPTTLVSTLNEIVGLTGDATNIYWEENRFPDPAGPSSAIKKMSKSGGEPVVIAGGLKALRGGLAITGTQLFFADTNFFDSSRLMKVSVSGGAVTVLATIVDPTQVKVPRKIAVDGLNLYWIDGSTVSKIPVNGGGIITLASGLQSPVDLKVDANEAIWTETVCCAHGQKGSIKKVAIAGGDVSILADGVDAPGAVALDASNNVYWTEGGPTGLTEGFGRIAKVPIGGGAVTTVASGVSDDLAPIAVDDMNVYIADKFTIKKVPIAGGQVEKLAGTDFFVRAIATDGVSVYWNEDPFSTVRKVPVGGGLVVTLAAGFGPAGPIAVDHTHVYWMDHFDTIRKVPIGGGVVVTLASNLAFLDDLVVDSTNVYFSEADTARIRTMSVEGGTISTLVAGPPFIFRSTILAVDSVNLYWVNQANVGSVPKAGGAPMFIVPGGLASDPFIPNAIAADGSAVYWTEVRGGTIKKASLGPGMLAASVSLSGSTFHTGQMITYQATLTPGSTPIQVDIYLGCLLPDGVTFLSLVQSAPGAISIALGRSPVPFSANVPLTPAAVSFAHTFTGAEPVGTYFAYAGLAIAGSNPFQPANQLSLAIQPFQFNP